MAIKIKKIEIKNFKLFREINVLFDDPTLIVFDGPNGFGKTSFFDAIELLFTGRIRRYSDLAKQIIDKRESYKENSFINSETEGDLIIKAEIDIQGESKFLMRKGERERLKALTNIQDFNLALYELTYFGDEEGTKIENESQYLTHLLSENYCENFEFLNYIEQEESAYLLKNKDKVRKEAIGHLFNTLDFETEIAKIKKAYSKIGELCGKPEADRLKVLEKNLQDDERNIIKEVEEEKYSRLIAWTELDWDQETVEFKDGHYADLVGEAGILEKLKAFILNKEEYKHYKVNLSIDTLFDKEDQLKEILLYYYFKDSCEEYSRKYDISVEIKYIQDELQKGLLAFVSQGMLSFEKTKEIIKDQIDLNACEQVVNNVIGLQKRLDEFSEIVSALKESRNVFISNFQRYEKESGEKNECPLCGFDWEAVGILKSKIDDQSDKINEITKEFANEIDAELEKLNANYIVPILNIFEEYKKANKIDNKFVLGLKKIASKRFSLEKICLQLKSLDINIDSFLNKTPVFDEKLKIEQLKDELIKLKKDVNLENIKGDYPDIFTKYFNDDDALVDLISLEAIDKKKKYLRWKYAIYQSDSLKKKQSEFERQKKKFESAKKMKEKIEKLKKIYETSLKRYQQQLIGDIEILFHIYSGRIVQDYQGGLGLFIFDKNGIRFLENPNKSHDAVFSMSSGQISALIIAFTLTLNKKYSKNKILFIDDPVQTLDELNVVGFVELLRHEFGDRQVFLSTHEDKMSAYMRYKFEKFGLKTQRVNFKEKYFS